MGGARATLLILVAASAFLSAQEPAWKRAERAFLEAPRPLSVLEALARDHGDQAGVLYWLGRAREESRLLGRAEAAYQASSVAAPNNPAPLEAWAEMRDRMLSDPDGALPIFERALRLAPPGSEAAKRLARRVAECRDQAEKRAANDRHVRGIVGGAVLLLLASAIGVFRLRA
ncbi:MAG TPA: hypothetical protein ENK43_12265 [Planctomycetes bacterium]|nr:hypothetical protein [Planctomycetota bacterium]